MKKFWNFARDSDNARTLTIDGEIAYDSFWGDAVVNPKDFKEELFSGSGDLTIDINSPGGDSWAASEIYTAIMDYRAKGNNVTIKVTAIAASAASVIAMASDTLLMSPTSYLMIHDPMTLTIGNESEHEEAITFLQKMKEGIINAYELKTKLSRQLIAQMMSETTWLPARDAVEMHFADGILGVGKYRIKTNNKPDDEERETEEKKPEEERKTEEKKPEEERKSKEPEELKQFSAARVFSQARAEKALLDKFVKPAQEGKPVNIFYKRLELIGGTSK